MGAPVETKYSKPIDKTLEKLAKFLNVPREELYSRIKRRRIKSSYKPILLKRDIGRNALAAIEVHKFDLPGIIVDIKPRRHYIHKQIAAHLIGYLSEISSSELRSNKYSGYRAGDYQTVFVIY